ncbi:tetratricopeptide repeat protein [Simiduia sp. 21SJ11W-1]|uniref:tetratricopeptide repeat protein n=1 Tax=Simiduia sp. 21SJ11W-1 TaxID=2909669 RepID=UPI0020A1D314|nr:tetratricopeptide repeat protein [Simiduia sp. 21SJ11W-1]UTA46647.1 tetratricopeptide repeat protein [Simiduia sp. 21SJ11W-1]
MNDQQALPWWQQSRLQYAAIGILIALMLFVIFILPNFVGPVAIDEADITAPAPSTKAAPAESPFADAQLARERKQAQEILNKVLQLQDQLEGQQVEQWGAKPYQDALDTAAKADEYYRQREFTIAQENYRATLSQLQALKAQASEALKEQLATGQSALDEKDATTATHAFSLALAIAPNNEQAQTGLRSAESLEAVLDLLRRGRLEEKTDHWEKARASYREALALDPNSPLAQAALTNIETKLRDRNFTRAMSAGFKAMDAGDFAGARKHFQAAGAIKPNDDAVPVALQQVNNQSLQTSINNKLAQARAAEADEKWLEANKLYQALLVQDSTLVDAVVGKLRTDARADLEKRTLHALENPLALNKPENYAAAQQTLAELNALNQSGPRLDDQRTQLAELLAKVDQPRQVILQSDNLTQVTIFHVGRIGNFEQHVMALKPGTYVAVGSRPGYRDVREEFVVGLNENQVSVEIRCTEKIALGS